MSKRELREFIRAVEQELPWNCPACGAELGEIRYATDATRMTVHLTGAVNEQYSHKAECPSCGHVLLHEDAGARSWR